MRVNWKIDLEARLQMHAVVRHKHRITWETNTILIWNVRKSPLLILRRTCTLKYGTRRMRGTPFFQARRKYFNFYDCRIHTASDIQPISFTIYVSILYHVNIVSFRINSRWSNNHSCTGIEKQCMEMHYWTYGECGSLLLSNSRRYQSARALSLWNDRVAVAFSVWF